MLKFISEIYDAIEFQWEKPVSNRILAAILIIVYFGFLLLIELKRRNFLPDPFFLKIPTSHFYAVGAAFTMLLIWEVIGLVFSISKSISVSVGKQLEILSLILLRNSFKELVNFSEPIQWQEISAPVLHILSDAAGAILIFFLLGIFYKLHKHFPITTIHDRQTRFIYTKKVISLILLVVFISIGIHHNYMNFFYGESNNFFETFYTVLIFSDIFIVLVSLRYCSNYIILFRNSGFAVTTLMIRLALTAPPYINVVLGVSSTVYAIALILVYNYQMKNNADYALG
jgi:hypothetical protein